MTENLLAKALAAHVRSALSSMLLETDSGEERAVTVWEGYLPARRTDNAEEYPFVIVRPVSGRMERDAASCTADIYCGCFGREETGYQFSVNMLRRIANSLLTLPSGALDARYVLEDGMEWELAKEQAYPSWVAVLHTTWNFKTPEVAFID